MSSQQPGPYGPPPPGTPGPYSPPPQTGGAPNPYAGVPPQPGGGYPGAPGPHGQAPVPPQQGGGRGKVVALAVGAVVVVCAVVAVVFAMSGTRYELTTPQTVADGYVRQGAGDARSAKSPFGKDEAPGVEADGGVSATYKNGSTRTLSFGGLHGTLDDPEAAVDWAMDEAAGNAGGAKPTGEARTFTPDGFDGEVMKCREYKVITMKMGMCSWGDDSTLGIISHIDSSGGLSNDDVDLREIAELTAKVRTDALTEAD